MHHCHKMTQFVDLAMGAPNIKKVEQESWGEQHPTEEPKLLAAFFKRGGAKVPSQKTTIF